VAARTSVVTTRSGDVAQDPQKNPAARRVARTKQPEAFGRAFLGDIQLTERPSVVRKPPEDQRTLQTQFRGNPDERRLQRSMPRAESPSDTPIRYERAAEPDEDRNVTRSFRPAHGSETVVVFRVNTVDVVRGRQLES
jgi:hypothetical protein